MHSAAFVAMVGGMNRMNRSRSPLSTAIVRVLLGSALLAATPRQGFASMSGGPIFTPGPPLGETRSYWNAPYFRIIEEAIRDPSKELDPCWCCGIGTNTVRWYSRSGEVLHEESDVVLDNGFLTIRNRCLGIWPRWEMPIPTKELDGARFLFASEGGRVLVHTYDVTDGHIAADVYVAGQFVRTLGPYSWDGSWSWTRFNDSGAAAFASKLPERDGAPDSARIVVVSDDASRLKEMKVAGRHVSFVPDATGSGIVCDIESIKYWITGNDSQVVLPNLCRSEPVAWGPDVALFDTWMLEGRRFALVELGSGTIRWTTPVSETDFHSHHRDSAVIEGEWVFAYDLEIEVFGDRDRGRHIVRIHDLESGELLYRWRSSYATPPPDPGRLVRFEGHIYFLTSGDFTQLDPLEVVKEHSGWALREEPAPNRVDRRRR